MTIKESVQSILEESQGMAEPFREKIVELCAAIDSVLQMSEEKAVDNEPEHATIEPLYETQLNLGNFEL